MKVKVIFSAMLLLAAVVLSSCGNVGAGEAVENNFSEILSVGENPVFVSVNIDNFTTTVEMSGGFSESLGELASAITSAGLTENPDLDDLPDPDTVLLSVEILRNGSTESQGMDCCHMDLYSDGTLSVFGSEQFAGSGRSYSLSEQDLKKIKAAAEKVTDNRTSCPQPMRITDPLSSYFHSGAMINTAGVSWSYTNSDGGEQSFVADALHPLDESASPVKINRLYSTAVWLGFPAGFEPDKVTIKGWDISPKGDTSSETVYHPKTEYENNFPSEGDYTGFYQLESNTVYCVTVTYDSAKYAERGFSGTADYYFETGELNE